MGGNLRASAIIAALLGLIVSRASAEHRGCAGNEVQVAAHAYTNYEYGYLITLPANAQTCQIKAPAPNHGVTIYPASPSNAELRIYAEYDASLEGSARQLAQHTAEAFISRYHLTKNTERAARLGGLTARDIVLGESHQTEGLAHYIHFILAYRPVPGGTGIVYTLLLEAPKKMTLDERLLTDLASSFRTLPIEH